jgi:hypothetical protein
MQSGTGLPDFSWCTTPKLGKRYQNTAKYSKRLQSISNTLQKYKMSRKYTKIFHGKKFQNIAKLEFLVRKYTIWQSCSGSRIFPAKFIPSHASNYYILENYLYGFRQTWIIRSNLYRYKHRYRYPWI